MLVDVNLLESPAPDWYRFHDLLRVYATERAQAEESERTARRGGAQAACAGTWTPQRLPPSGGAAAVPGPAARNAIAWRLRSRWPRLQTRLAWYDHERGNVLSASRQAAAAGLHDLAWRLPTALFPLFNRRDNWADCIAAHRIAVGSARHR